MPPASSLGKYLPNATDPAPVGILTTELWRLFQTYKSRPFVFVQPGGNAGDYLIYRGAEKLGRLAGLHFTSLTHAEFMRTEHGAETVVYIHGGGGYNPLWSGEPMEALHRASGHKGVVIQGPQTYWDDVGFLRDRVVQPILDAKCERLVLMARERVSYDLVREVLPSRVELLLDHDTALNLKREDLQEYLPQRRKGYKLYAIRADKEATELAGQKYFSAWVDPARFCRELGGWIRLHAEARELTTNRLHSSILGSILNIPTVLLPNGYFKNRAIWEHSLRPRGVKWLDEIPVGLFERALHQTPGLSRALRSRSVQQWIQHYHGLK